MAQTDFIEQLRALGYAVEELGEGKVAFPYSIPTGVFADHQIRLGFTVPGDFPITPPSGPHMSPRLLPLQSGGTHPSGGIHDSPFGPEWEYWSRPIHNWNLTRMNVKVVLAHVWRLFDTQ